MIARFCQYSHAGKIRKGGTATMIDSKKQPSRDVFKSGLVKNAYFSPVYEFPLLKRVSYKPEKAIPFDKAARSTKFDHWIHFYIHDKQFERIWNNPKQYLGMLKKFAGVITPDFSLYRALPLAMQIWNTYRNRAIAYWLQSNGVKIVPNIRWGDWRTYPFAFEGIERGGTVAVSTNGCIQKKIDRYYFIDGLERMLEKLQPDTIINYSYTPNDIFDICKKQGVEVIQIENFAKTLRRGEA
jgi:hypothetical protein